MSKAPALASMLCSVVAFVCSLMVVSSEDVLVSVVCTAGVTDSALCCVLHDAAVNTTDANTRRAKILLFLIDIFS
jgi:hypothetical protein